MTSTYDTNCPVQNKGSSDILRADILPSSLIQETLVDGLFDFAVLPPVHSQANEHELDLCLFTFYQPSPKCLTKNSKMMAHDLPLEETGLFKSALFKRLNRRTNPRCPSASCRHLWVPWPWPFCAPWPACGIWMTWCQAGQLGSSWRFRQAEHQDV